MCKTVGKRKVYFLTISGCNNLAILHHNTFFKGSTHVRCSLICIILILRSITGDAKIPRGCHIL